MKYLLALLLTACGGGNYAPDESEKPMAVSPVIQPQVPPSGNR